MALDNVEKYLINTYEADTKNARLSFLNKLEEKYVRNQEDSDVIDLRSLSIVKEKGSIAKMKPKYFGSLCSYSCPQGRKTIKLLKKIIIKRQCRVVQRDSEGNFKEKLFSHEEYYALVKSVNLDKSMEDSLISLKEKDSSNEKTLLKKSSSSNRFKNFENLSEMTICDLSSQNLNSNYEKKESSEKSAVTQPMIRRKYLPLKKISNFERRNVLQDTSDITICDLSSININDCDEKGCEKNGSFSKKTGGEGRWILDHQIDTKQMSLNTFSSDQMKQNKAQSSAADFFNIQSQKNEKIINLNIDNKMFKKSLCDLRENKYKKPGESLKSNKNILHDRKCNRTSEESDIFNHILDCTKNNKISPVNIKKEKMKCFNNKLKTSGNFYNFELKRNLCKSSDGINKDIFRKLHRKGKNLHIELKEDIGITTEHTNVKTNNFYRNRILESSLYSHSFFNLKIDDFSLVSDKISHKNITKEKDILQKKSLLSVHDSVQPVIRHSKIKPLPCPSIPKKRFTLKRLKY